jgi:hypothetical protein
LFPKHKRQRRIRGREPVHSHLWSKRKRHDLHRGDEIAGPLELIRGSSWKSKKRIKESISSEARRRQINADHSIATRRQELSVSAILLGIFGGLVGVVIGVGLGLALGSVLAAVLHVSPMEGGAGYFAVAIVLIVALIIAPSSIVFVLYGAQG